MTGKTIHKLIREIDKDFSTPKSTVLRPQSPVSSSPSSPSIGQFSNIDVGSRFFIHVFFFFFFFSFIIIIIIIIIYLTLLSLTFVILYHFSQFSSFSFFFFFLFRGC